MIKCIKYRLKNIFSFSDKAGRLDYTFTFFGLTIFAFFPVLLEVYVLEGMSTNLFIGLYNLYLYMNGGDWWFNLLIGSLNIGVWVFNRKKI